MKRLLRKVPLYTKHISKKNLNSVKETNPNVPIICFKSPQPNVEVKKQTQKYIVPDKLLEPQRSEDCVEDTNQTILDSNPVAITIITDKCRALRSKKATIANPGVVENGQRIHQTEKSIKTYADTTTTMPKKMKRLAKDKKIQIHDIKVGLHSPVSKVLKCGLYFSTPMRPLQPNMAAGLPGCSPISALHEPNHSSKNQQSHLPRKRLFQDCNPNVEKDSAKTDTTSSNEENRIQNNPVPSNKSTNRKTLCLSDLITSDMNIQTSDSGMSSLQTRKSVFQSAKDTRKSARNALVKDSVPRSRHNDHSGNEVMPVQAPSDKSISKEYGLPLIESVATRSKVLSNINFIPSSPKAITVSAVADKHAVVARKYYTRSNYTIHGSKNMSSTNYESEWEINKNKKPGPKYYTRSNYTIHGSKNMISTNYESEWEINKNKKPGPKYYTRSNTIHGSKNMISANYKSEWEINKNKKPSSIKKNKKSTEKTVISMKEFMEQINLYPSKNSQKNSTGTMNSIAQVFNADNSVVAPSNGYTSVEMGMVRTQKVTTEHTKYSHEINKSSLKTDIRSLRKSNEQVFPVGTPKYIAPLTRSRTGHSGQALFQNDKARGSGQNLLHNHATRNSMRNSTQNDTSNKSVPISIRNLLSSLEGTHASNPTVRKEQMQKKIQTDERNNRHQRQKQNNENEYSVTDSQSTAHIKSTSNSIKNKRKLNTPQNDAFFDSGTETASNNFQHRTMKQSTKKLVADGAVLQECCIVSQNHTLVTTYDVSNSQNNIPPKPRPSRGKINNDQPTLNRVSRSRSANKGLQSAILVTEDANNKNMQNNIYEKKLTTDVRHPSIRNSFSFVVPLPVTSAPEISAKSTRIKASAFTHASIQSKQITETNQSGRPKRTRVAPVPFWTNQRVIYGIDENHLPSVLGVSDGDGHVRTDVLSNNTNSMYVSYKSRVKHPTNTLSETNRNTFSKKKKHLEINVPNVETVQITDVHELIITESNITSHPGGTVNQKLSRDNVKDKNEAEKLVDTDPVQIVIDTDNLQPDNNTNSNFNNVINQCLENDSLAAIHNDSSKSLSHKSKKDKRHRSRTKTQPNMSVDEVGLNKRNDGNSIRPDSALRGLSFVGTQNDKQSIHLQIPTASIQKNSSKETQDFQPVIAVCSKPTKRKSISSMTSSKRKRLTTLPSPEEIPCVSTEISVANGIGRRGLSVGVNESRGIMHMVHAHNELFECYSSRFQHLVFNESTAGVEVASSIENIRFATGFVRLQPGIITPIQKSNLEIVYFLVEGKVLANIHTSSRVILPLEHFFVPADVHYRIKNLSTENSLLTFNRINKV